MTDSEMKLQEILATMLDSDATDDVRHVATFAEMGVLTDNAGLVVTMTDGREFQITIVHSR
jgi:hypothetical protein